MLEKGDGKERIMRKMALVILRMRERRIRLLEQLKMKGMKMMGMIVFMMMKMGNYSQKGRNILHSNSVSSTLGKQIK